MIIIGERINSSRAKIAEAIEKRDVSYIQNEAIMQVKAGADYLDLNAGIFREKEIESLEWLIKVVQEVTDKPLCIDAASPKTFAATLSLCQRKPILNSITGRKEEIDAVIPLIKEYSCSVVALCLADPEARTIENNRIETANRLIDNLTSNGVDLDNIYVDPVVSPISADINAATSVLNTIEQIMKQYPTVHTICGVSNISFGLPLRKQLNANFIIMAMERGLDALIVDPCDKQLMANITTTSLLLGRDEYCLSYINAYREGRLPG